MRICENSSRHEKPPKSSRLSSSPRLGCGHAFIDLTIDIPVLEMISVRGALPPEGFLAHAVG